DAAARVGVKHGSRAGGHARTDGVGARSQDDWHARAELDPGRVPFCEEREVLGAHVAGFESGVDENVGTTRDGGFYTPDLGRFLIDGSGESKRPVENPARYLSTLRHLAKRGRVDGRRDLGRYCFDGGEDRNPRRAEANLGE